MEFLPGVEDDLVQKAYTAYQLNPSDLSLYFDLLRIHPFVKESSAVEVDSSIHSFSIFGFQLHIKSFMKWVKSPEGIKYGAKAGGLSDDALYCVSPLLREIMPRGCHEVIANNKANGNKTRMAFVGIRKFTGLGAGDEDEESNSTNEFAAFFFGGKLMKDAVTFWRTLKSNGENCKFRVWSVDECIYLVAGSKNTCVIWPAADPFVSRSNNGEVYPVDVIGSLISKWYLGLDENARDAFLKDALTVGSFMGEVNRSDSEHIIPIPNTFLEYYTILDEKSGLPLDPGYCLSLFDKHGLSHVSMSLHPMDDLAKLVNEIRLDSNAEGAVLYLNDQSSNVIGLLKVKSDYYVIARRLRENMKSQILFPLKKVLLKESVLKPEDFDEVEKKAAKYLDISMAKLQHVPNCSKLHTFWAEVATGFMRWWLGRLRNGESFDALNTAFENNYATMLVKFFEDTGRPRRFGPE